MNPPQDFLCVQSLMRMVLYRAIYDWILYRSSRRPSHRKDAAQAYRWLFLEEESTVSLEMVCEVLCIETTSTREWARSLDLATISSLYRGGRLKDPTQLSRAHHGTGRVSKKRSHREDPEPEEG